MFRYVLISFCFCWISCCSPINASDEVSGKPAQSSSSKKGMTTIKDLGLLIEKPFDKKTDAQKKLPLMTKEEIALRTQIANMCLLVYGQINNNALFYDECPPTNLYKFPGNHWLTPVCDKLSFLVPAHGRTLRQAIQDVLMAKESYIIDCQMAADFSMYAILETLFPNAIDENLKGELSVEDQQVLYVGCGRVIFTKNSKKLLNSGDTVYIKGHPDYKKRHPNGVFQGENLTLIGYNAEGDQMYLGFGEFFKSGPRKAADIRMHLAQKYMKNSSVIGQEHYDTAHENYSRTLGEMVTKIKDQKDSTDVTKCNIDFMLSKKPYISSVCE